MWPASATLEMSASVCKILADLIHERIGMHYDLSKRELLAEKLSPLAVEQGFSNFLDFYYLLKYGPQAEKHWPHVMNALSVQETYFWREMDQVNALVDHILPAYAKSRAREPIGIWCAACATGEEPLTIAMALQEAGWFERAEIHIHATDASQAAIAKALRGRYRERSFRAIPPNLRERYFRPVVNEWEVSAALHARITFSTANLVDAEQIAALARVPIIFCRNVFIYFADETISRTVHVFAQNMMRPGYLFVGAAESLLKLTDQYELQQAGDAFVYARK